jgi:hypothetical protein
LFAWPARVDEESKENFTWLSGLAVSKAFPISVKESVKEAAASTAMSPVSFFTVVVVASVVVVVELDAVVAFLAVVEVVPAVEAVVELEAASVDVVVDSAAAVVVVVALAATLLLSWFLPHAASSNHRTIPITASGRPRRWN